MSAYLISNRIALRQALIINSLLTTSIQRMTAFWWLFNMEIPNGAKRNEESHFNSLFFWVTLNLVYCEEVQSILIAQCIGDEAIFKTLNYSHYFVN